MFVSVFLYAQRKQHGDRFGEFQKDEFDRGADALTPAFRTLHAARRLEEAHVMIEGSTLITKARCLAAGTFLRTDDDVWLSIDDDVDASSRVLAAMIARVRQTRGIAIAGYAMRQGGVCLETPAGAEWREVEPGISYGKVTSGGLGCAVMHFEAVRRAARNVPHFLEANRSYPVLFREGLTHPTGGHPGRWLGEDVSFLLLATGLGIPVDGFLSLDVLHDGLRIPTEGEPSFHGTST